MEWTGAKYADRPTVEVQAWVDALPERVWAIVSDVRLMPEMSPELQSAEWCDGTVGDAAVGRRFVGRSKHDALGEWETTSYVVECEAPRVFTWAVQDPATPTALWRFTLEPENGGTKLRQWMRLGPGRSGLSLAIDRMPDKEEKIVFVRLREFENAMTGTLAAIKERAEAAHA
ncbi:SRPBCC family protein [Amycolatopsis regifaucium]|uniref:Cyclase n=1 Tax=Amycolatopsis regifaucium TaxID=546365 RepID=A0A154M4Q8_9PSEU|nr:SRPBCC family protein [Amycolatopsis regifaucium]KZB79400.1 cyclase [Amycolatopsis regifaucium]OKA07581.1 cyclase [Amycolatopsis regifaucium]SFH07801.1 Polyketide cyclase / dehydrase and lipid transport [Amycolatopsis regifaucium]